MTQPILPNDFNWAFYLDKNPDLTNTGINTEESAVKHYLKHGYKENRIYSENESNHSITEIDSIKEKNINNFDFKNSKEKQTKEGKKNNILFTICASNYLAQAITLGDSLIEHNDDYEFIIFLIDEIPQILKNVNFIYDIIEIKNIGIPNVREFNEKYNITEYSTAVKPFCFTYLFNKKFEINNITYLDPDILIFNKLTIMEDMLKTNDILLTPHFFSPIYDDLLPSEQTILNAGLYNLGYISLKRSENTFDFLKWWSHKLHNFCKIDLCNGLFVDQLWVNFVPIYFKNVGIIDNLGYNMAYWNLHERNINQGNLVNNNDELVFYHYSGYKFGNDISIHSNRYNFENRGDILPLFLKYIELVFKNGYNIFSKLTCKYNLPKNNEGVNLCGFINGNFGLGKYSKGIKKSLEKLSINHNMNEIIANCHNYKKKINVTKINNYDKNILVFNPDNTLKLLNDDYLKNKYNIGVWFWELNELPEIWLKNSINYSEVWAPTDFLFNVFKNNLSKDIKIVRVDFPVINPKKLNKNESKKHFGINDDEFLCLFIFDFLSDLYRKNPYAVIETFKNTFTNNEKCKLIIKSHNGKPNQIKKMLEFIKNDERIIFINESFNENKLNILLNSSDVYISLHRSEGLGLTLMESILLEKPTLCTNYSGNIDFCLPEWSELVDYKLIEVSDKSFYNKLSVLKNQFWADPSIEDASIKLRKIYENYPKYVEKSKLGKKFILEKYNEKSFNEQIKKLF
jgi:hypothetical protein